ncbi:MAG: DUF3850 domain-containing protein [Candidatus Woesearchaeota archaeon]
MIIEKKIWPKYFDLIRSGKKNVEVRVADFDISKGDELLLREYDPEKKEYTGRKIKKKAGNINLIKGDEAIKMFLPEKIKENGFYIIELKD